MKNDRFSHKPVIKANQWFYHDVNAHYDAHKDDNVWSFLESFDYEDFDDGNADADILADNAAMWYLNKKYHLGIQMIAKEED